MKNLLSIFLFLAISASCYSQKLADLFVNNSGENHSLATSLGYKYESTKFDEDFIVRSYVIDNTENKFIQLNLFYTNNETKVVLMLTSEASAYDSIYNNCDANSNGVIVDGYEVFEEPGFTYKFQSQRGNGITIYSIMVTKK